MADICETVKIVAPFTDENQSGYVVINAVDLADGDVLHEEQPAEVVEPTNEPEESDGQAA